MLKRSIFFCATFLLVCLLGNVRSSQAEALPGTYQVAGPSVAAQKKAAKKQKKSAPAKPRSAEPEKPKEPWQLPMKVVLVRASFTGCEPNCPEWIMAEGEITGATPAVFRKVLKKIGKRKLPVVISSPGGRVEAAMEIGRMIRKAALPVAVGRTNYHSCSPWEKNCTLPKEAEGYYDGLGYGSDGYCLSACPLILAAGTERLGAGTRIGLHKTRRTWYKEKIYYRETYRIEKGRKKVVSRKEVSRKRTGSFVKDGIDKALRKQLRTYLGEMGTSLSFIDEMEKASFTSMNDLSWTKLQELRLVTSYQAAENLTRSAVCIGAAPAPHCRVRAIKPPADEPMRVVRIRATGACEPLCPEWLAARGRITKETPAQFRMALDAMGEYKLPVMLNAPGGDFDAALEIGRMIRARGLITAVAASRLDGCGSTAAICGDSLPSLLASPGRLVTWGSCERECFFVLAGGVQRYAALAAGSAFPPPASLVTAQRGKTAAAIAEDYLREMSVSSDLLVKARRATAEKPLRFNPDDLWNLALGTKRGTPFFLTDLIACKGTSPLPNCIYRTASPTEAPAGEATVARIRQAENCEPNCAEWIMLRGRITPDTYQRFAALLEQTGAAKLPIMIDSPGGDLDASMEIGRLIRKKRLVVAVAASVPIGCRPDDKTCGANSGSPLPYRAYLVRTAKCDEECLFILAGGVVRMTKWLTSAAVPPMAAFSTRQQGKEAAEVIEKYLDEMSVSGVLVKKSIDVKGPLPVILTPSDLMLYHLGNDSSGPDSIAGNASCRSSSAATSCVFRSEPSG